MNQLVQILKHDDGEESDNPEYWHLTDPCNSQGLATLCESEFYGHGESDCEFKVKTVLRGGITCPNCEKKIKTYKAVSL
jgi:hypothetical protein